MNKKNNLSLLLFITAYIIFNLYFFTLIFDYFINANNTTIALDYKFHYREAEVIMNSGQFNLFNMGNSLTAFIAGVTGAPLKSASILYYTCMQVVYLFAVILFGKKLLPKQTSNSMLLFFIATVCLSSNIFNLYYGNYLYGGEYPGNTNMWVTGINTWHNPASISVKPFAVITFFMFYTIMRKLDKGDLSALTSRRVFFRFVLYSMLFSVLLLVSVYAKINWIAAFAPAVFILLTIWWLTSGLSISVLKKCMFLGLLFIPAGLFAIYTTYFYFPEGIIDSMGNTGIILDPKPLNIHHIILLGCSIIFPLLVLFLRFGSFIKSRCYKLAWIIYIISYLEQVLLSEVGDRVDHGNLTWGRHYAGIILLAVSAIEFYHYIYENRDDSQNENETVLTTTNKNIRKRIKALIEKVRTAPLCEHAGLLLMAMHLFSGLIYIYNCIFMGVHWW